MGRVVIEAVDGEAAVFAAEHARGGESGSRGDWRSSRRRGGRRSTASRRRSRRSSRSPAWSWRPSSGARWRKRRAGRCSSSRAVRASARRRSCAPSWRCSRARAWSCGSRRPTGRAAKRLGEATGARGDDAPPPARVRPQVDGLQARPRAGRSRRARSSSTRHRCSTCRWPTRSRRPSRPGRGSFSSATSISFPAWGRARSSATSSTRGPCRRVRLRQIFRQAARSLIVTNAHRINDGELPLPGPPEAEDADFFIIERRDPERARDTVHRARHVAHPRSLRPRSRPRHPGAHADEPRPRRRPRLNEALAGGPQPRWPRPRPRRAHLSRRRQGHAAQERLRQERLQRRRRVRERASKRKKGRWSFVSTGGTSRSTPPTSTT